MIHQGQLIPLYRHCKSGHYLLVIDSGGGQHDHTQVYSVDPHNFRVRPLFDSIGVIYGDASGLAKGHVVEHCPDQYVDPKPDGFKRHNPDTAEYLSRVWTYHPQTHRFTPGHYHADKK